MRADIYEVQCALPIIVIDLLIFKATDERAPLSHFKKMIFIYVFVYLKGRESEHSIFNTIVYMNKTGLGESRVVHDHTAVGTYFKPKPLGSSCLYEYRGTKIQ